MRLRGKDKKDKSPVGSPGTARKARARGRHSQEAVLVNHQGVEAAVFEAALPDFDKLVITSANMDYALAALGDDSTPEEVASAISEGDGPSLEPEDDWEAAETAPPQPPKTTAIAGADAAPTEAAGAAGPPQSPPSAVVRFAYIDMVDAAAIPRATWALPGPFTYIELVDAAAMG